MQDVYGRKLQHRVSSPWMNPEGNQLFKLGNDVCRGTGYRPCHVQIGKLIGPDESRR